MNKAKFATLAGGCFWCTEAIFTRLKGVISVRSGYAGGQLSHPSYEQVSSGATGHVEAVQIEFDPKVISFAKLLKIFWATHNPTTLNQQGSDVGPQYRSAIFYHDQNQREVAEQSKRALEQEKTWPDPVVTTIEPFTNFFAAEDYHQDYYQKNSQAPYCQVVITPKLQKLIHQFAPEMKEEFRKEQL